MAISLAKTGQRGRAKLGKRIFLMLKRILFPGTDIATRKRMKFCKYFQAGDISTLDAGCGNGAFSYHAYRLGNRALGITINTGEVRRCEEFRDYLGIDPSRCRFIGHNIYDLANLGEKFDQIICFETLEHLEKDEEVLHLFSQVMNPGGLLHLGTPYQNRSPYYGEVISETEDGGHVRLGYTYETFEEMLARAGFEVIITDKAVGFFSQKLADLLRWVVKVPCRGLPNWYREGICALLLILFYPVTVMDVFISASPLCIYVMARKRL